MSKLTDEDKQFCQKHLKAGKYVTLTMMIPATEVPKFLEILNNNNLRYGATHSVADDIKFYKNDPNEKENA